MSLKREKAMETIMKCFRRVMTGGAALFGWKTEVAVDKRLTQYVDEALRDGVIGEGRYVVLQGKIRKL